MKRLLFAFTAGAVLTPASARAITPGGTYDFCGGSGFIFCAAIDLSVAANAAGGYTVTLTAANRSLASGSNAPAQFVSIGLENVLPPGESLSSPANFHLRQGTWNGTGYVYADVCGANPTCWNMASNKPEGGGVNVDFDANTTRGNQVSIASNCLATEPHWNQATLNTCARGDDVTLWRPIQISFDVAQNITSADLYVKAIANGSTECLTGSTKLPCTSVPPVTTTPEPASLALFGTGLLALLGQSTIRRRGDTRA